MSTEEYMRRNLAEAQRIGELGEGEKAEVDAILAAAIENINRWRHFMKLHPEIYFTGARDFAARIVAWAGDPRYFEVLAPPQLRERGMCEAKGQTKQ